MAKSLKYDFDKVHLKRGVYIPQAHAVFNLEQDIIRRSLVEVFLGKKTIPINIVSQADNEKAMQLRGADKKDI